MTIIAPDLGIEVNDFVATVEIQRPPNNFFDAALIETLAATLADMDADPGVRAIVLCSAGKHFCAGNNYGGKEDSAKSSMPRSATPPSEGNPIYTAAVKLFATQTPVIAAIQGAAIGGGFGLALMPDFRVACPEARFSANFVKLGFHPGFGLTHTLPRLIGQQQASLMFQTGKRIDGEEAARIGLIDRLTSQDKLRDEARALASEIAENAPLAVTSVRQTLRDGLPDAIKRATDHEFAEQYRLQQTEDHKEGIRAVAERRPGNFEGR